MKRILFICHGRKCHFKENPLSCANTEVFGDDFTTFKRCSDMINIHIK